MQLTDHFADTELGVQPGSGATPQQVANAVQLCTVLLEPIRAQFGPVSLSCGYRPPADNQATGGAATSQHLYIGLNSAADIIGAGTATLQAVFDWIRLESHLPFDQVILERSKATGLDACVHVSYNGSLAVQRREALVGETHGTGAYTQVQVNP